MSASLRVGTTIGGKYLLLRPLGEGGMGAVYEAQNELTFKRVAVKVMHASLAADAQAAARMLREAQTASRIRHPNVVDLYDAGHDGDAVFLVMEYLEGESLFQAVRRGGLPIHLAIDYLVDAMRGVAAAHRAGVIHRDIKPDNIFLAREGDDPRPVPKVLDFGVSKFVDDRAERLTRTDVTLGTPLYMSYEQLCGHRDEVDARTDVYAFGVILYELLTGRPPHLALTIAHLGMLVATVEPPSPRMLRPEVPAALDEIVRRATARYRERRTKSLAVLIRQLAPFTRPEGFPRSLEVAPPLMAGDLGTTQATGQAGPTVSVGRDEHEGRVSGPAAGTAPSLPVPGPPRRQVALVAAALLGVFGLLVFLSVWSPWSEERPTPSTTAVRAEPSAESATEDEPALTLPTGVLPLGGAAARRTVDRIPFLPSETDSPEVLEPGAIDAGNPPPHGKQRRVYRAGKPRSSEF